MSREPFWLIVVRFGPLTDGRDREDPVGSQETVELALRPVGLVVSLAAAVGSALALAAVLAGALDRNPAPVAAAVVACSAAGLWWWRLGPAWVRVQADRYANALLDAAELLVPVGASTMSSEAAT